EGLPAVAGLAHDVNAPGLEQAAQAVAEEGMIVGDKNPHLRLPSWTFPPPPLVMPSMMPKPSTARLRRVSSALPEDSPEEEPSSFVLGDHATRRRCCSASPCSWVNR